MADAKDLALVFPKTFVSDWAAMAKLPEDWVAAAAGQSKAST